MGVGATDVFAEASTVVCALIVVGQRPRPAQAGGVLAALAAVALIALG